MKYQIFFSCVSHTGHRRTMNQDNFICDSRYMGDGLTSIVFPFNGYFSWRHPKVVGIFDGMGGEECGEVASFLAAREAAAIKLTDKPVNDLLTFCKKANKKICQYAEDHDISAMGTTAALLAFGRRQIGLCNIGDSKIFCFAKKELKQLSVDHVAPAIYGMKPPLFQNLGIPPSELMIDPYVEKRRYNDGDIYLVCSDGLTDMLSQEEIADILLETEVNETIERLLEKALGNGGKDNITIILCKVKQEIRSPLSRIFKLIKEKRWKMIF